MLLVFQLSHRKGGSVAHISFDSFNRFHLVPYALVLVSASELGLDPRSHKP